MGPELAEGIRTPGLRTASEQPEGSQELTIRIIHGRPDFLLHLRTCTRGFSSHRLM